jgi:hypothetical protein
MRGSKWPKSLLHNMHFQVCIGTCWAQSNFPQVAAVVITLLADTPSIPLSRMISVAERLL